MKEQLRILCQLQGLDLRKRLVANGKEKCDASEVRHLWHEVRLLGQSIVADKEKLLCLEKVCVRQEDDLGEVSNQCKEMEDKLYGGEITNMKEMDAVKVKCEAMRKDITLREDEVMAQMVYMEQIKIQITESETLLLEKKRLHADKQLQLSRLLAGFDQQLAEVGAEYDRLAAQVDAELMNQYRQLGRKLAQPVALLENGVCGGCRRNIPTNQILLTQTNVVHCDNCGRLLLLEEEEEKEKSG